MSGETDAEEGRLWDWIMESNQKEEERGGMDAGRFGGERGHMSKIPNG